MRRLLLLLGCVCLFGAACSGLDYSKSYWGAAGFHPKSIAILPVSVGRHETAKEVLEDVLAESLSGTGYYQHLLLPAEVQARALESPEFSGLLSDYVVKLHTLGESDEQKARAIGRACGVQALLQVDLTSWGYGLIEGDKKAWLGLRMMLVDAVGGELMWEGRHRVVQEYLLVQPVLRDLCEELVGEMLARMPH